jgi:23S rRNA (uracil1939-C5)-methyltransferase
MAQARGAINIADLFCGAGTFTGGLAEQAQHITAIDSEGPATAALTKAASLYKNVSVQKRDLFKNPLSAAELKPFDTVILDPPRAGAKAQAEALARSSVPKIIAVSCNPATFARDAKILIEGGYILQSASLIDQFTYSAHCELVALFSR